MSNLASLRINLVIVLLCFPTVAQVSGKQDATSHDYSKEGVVGERLETKLVFQSDGSYTREQKTRIRIQSDAGVQEYAVLRPPYQTSLEHIEVLDVRVTKPNGSVVISPLDSIQDAPSQIYPGAAEFANLHEKHVPVKGLEPGDILESSIRWQVETPLAAGHFWFGHTFLKSAIVLAEQLEISVPRDREVKFKSQNVQPTIREENGRRMYTWKTSNLESQNSEKQREVQGYDAIRGHLPGPDVLISSFRTWEEVGRWYESLQKEKVQPSAEVKMKAEELTKGLRDDDAKLRVIYNYVSLRYHYVGIAFGVGRYQPHAASEIFANQYGDCKDKHTLLAALLSAVGIRAYPALISSRMTVDPDVPMPAQFDHVISVVPQGSTLSWMDTTPEVTAMGYLATHLRGKPALLIMPDKVAFQTTPLNSIFPSKYTNTVTAKLDADGTLQAHVEATYRGDDSELTYRYLFRRVPESQWKDFAQKNFYGARLGGTITSVGASSPEKTEEPFAVRYEYTLRDFLGGERHRFAVPLSPLTIPEVKDADLDRTTPLWLGDVGEQVYKSRIELPKEWSAAQPMPLDLKESFAEFHGDTEVNGNVLVTKRRLLLKVNAITPDQLKSYKEFQKAISDNHALYIFPHVNADFPASGPVSTPSQGLARAGELARRSLIQLPGSSNSEALQSEQDALRSIQTKDYTSAITALRRAVSLDSTFSRAWIEMGLIYYSGTREINLSLNAFQKAVEADPKQVVPYKILAFMYLGMGRQDDAMATWKKLQSISPDDLDLKANFSASH
ncbi:MAG: Transglutaminase-like enzyme [Candidatus Sulfotelmatobacter sp.]|nr:Transglutaminase-like enzyme [Candidatus Sulfotelmatobacter sp.]